MRARITTGRKGPVICVPADPVSVAVALADKIDTLVGFWAIDEKPTGSKDPYALRRAALGVIRIAFLESMIFACRDRCLRWHIKQGTVECCLHVEMLSIGRQL